MKEFDAIMIGAGQAGPSLAQRLSEAGMTVAFVERKLFGVTIEGPVRVDLKKAKARADAVVAESRTGVERRLRELAGSTVIEGHARFEGPQRVRVGDELLTAPRIFINVGARASVPDMPGVHDVPFLNNRSILELDRLPEHLIIVGGSYVGLEFAQMYRRFGAEVTVIEKSARVIAREDEEVSESIRDILTNEGVTIRTNTECISLAPHERGVEVGLDCKEGPP